MTLETCVCRFFLTALGVLAAGAPLPAQCLEALSEPRSEHAATGVAGLLLFGGGIGRGSSLSSVDVLDTATGVWSVAALSEARSELAAASSGDRAYFGGGVRYEPLGAPVALDTVDVFDCATGAWTVAHLSVPRAGLAAGAVGGRVLFAGGYATAGLAAVPSAVVDVLDTATDTWSAAPALSEPRWALAVAAVGDRVLFGGGWNGAGASAAVDVYDATSGSWTSIGPLSVARSAVRATTVGSRVLFAGGFHSGGTESDVVDVYDAATDTWTTAQLSDPRGALAAATLGSYAFFAGGLTASLFPRDTIDVYDALEDRWFALSLSTARAFATALATGDALFVAGGGGLGIHSGAVDRFGLGFPKPFGSDALACPCGNAPTGASGCASSLGVGAALAGSGCPSVSNGDLTLTASGLPPGKPALLLSGAPSAPIPFGDGLLVLAAPRIIALGAGDASGAASWQSPLAAPGHEVAFQAWYRDPSGPCANGSNTTNGVRLTPEL